MSAYADVQVEKAKCTLATLAENGSDLSNPRQVVYFFYGDQLAAIANEMCRLGYAVHVEGDTEYWHVTERHRAMIAAGYDIGDMEKSQCFAATRTEVCDENWRTTDLHALYTLAKSHGVLLDGWHAEVD